MFFLKMQIFLYFFFHFAKGSLYQLVRQTCNKKTIFIVSNPPPTS